MARQTSSPAARRADYVYRILTLLAYRWAFFARPIAGQKLDGGTQSM